jgi:hypothetical protein
MASKVSTVACSDPADAVEMMRDMMGPQAVDQMIRQAISTCWMMLPVDKRTTEAVEKEIRRLVDRALANLREDMMAFGITDPPSSAGESSRRAKKKLGA